VKEKDDGAVETISYNFFSAKPQGKRLDKKGLVEGKTKKLISFRLKVKRGEGQLDSSAPPR